MVLSQKNSIFTKVITRGELPALERRGVLAQEIVGDDILVITFHQAKVNFETSNGIAVEVPSELLDMRPGVSDTVVLGSVSKSGHVVLLDMLMLKQKSYRMRPWRERLDVLERLQEELPADVKKKVIMSNTWKRGLMKAFDQVEANGGMGLIVREPGKTMAMVCNGR